MALMVEALRDLRAEKDKQLAEKDASIAELRVRMERMEMLIERMVSEKDGGAQ